MRRARFVAYVLALVWALVWGVWDAPLTPMHAPANVSHHAGFVESNGCSIQPDPSGDGTYWYRCP